jgi:hypothetical protein
VREIHRENIERSLTPAREPRHDSDRKAKKKAPADDTGASHSSKS